MSTLDIPKLKRAFDGRQDIQGAIQAAASAPEWIELFNAINSYICDLRDDHDTASEPATKKRKLEEPLTHDAANGSRNEHRGLVSREVGPEAINGEVLLQIKDISIILPQRKKFTLEFTPSHILARNPQNELVAGIGYAWTNIQYAFCVPVPEKATKQYTYVLFPRNAHLPTKTHIPPDPLIFTIPATPPKPGAVVGKHANEAAAYADTHKDLLHWAIGKYLAAAGNLVVIEEPSEAQFTSAVREAHRPKEKAFHVKGFRGSKDGCLFLLASGFLWLFKKPVVFIPRSAIVGVSYTSVLQRTFNLNIEVALGDFSDHKNMNGNGTAGSGEETQEEFEFAMLDQSDFEGIETYVKRHGLQDLSMAEQRKARRLGINGVKNENNTAVHAAKDGDDEEVLGHLEAAERALQDEEDEEEEDYDPGSEGESEGSGSDTDEGEGEGGDEDNYRGNEEDAEDGDNEEADEAEEVDDEE